MWLLADARRYRAPYAQVKPAGRAAPQSRSLLLLLAVGTGLSLGAAPAVAANDDNWANVEIERNLAERSREAGERPWRGSMRDTDDDDGARPQRRSPIEKRTARRNRKSVTVASLAPTPSPDPTRQNSVAETPKPAKPEAKTANRRNKLGPVVASLGRDFLTPPIPQLPSLFGGPIRWVASADCLVKPLQGVLSQVAALFGALQVNSTCRSPSHNRRVGGARRSQHLTGSAVDFRISGNSKAVLTFLKAQKVVGGYKHYGSGVFHIDTGPRRTW